MKKRNINILSPKEFGKRVIAYTVVSLGLLIFSLGIGVLGYHFIGDLGWVNSIYNASMILTGMGPIDEMKTDAAKLFASVYALFSGVVFLSTVAIFFAPFAHRLMHLLRVDDLDD
ncbi:hypothetical protein [Allomuricauda sp. M10]|jgi:hypothetical protein|uniref:hypothetical protein n=1 Tax=Allomuricauda sp. M10 TaxID=2683292 RepID=UPI001D17D7C5|nr:hypothetical protein [Muricauda sp. M10]